jgi:hypothetical protein
VFVFCGNGAGRADLVARCQGLPQRAGAADLVMPRPIHIDLVIAKPLKFDTSEWIFPSSAAYGPMKSISCTRFFVEIRKSL